MSTQVNIIIAGIGGQGVLTLSKCLAAAATHAFPFASRTEERGLSQRGGAVTAAVRFGDSPVAPFLGLRGASFLLGLDPLETVRSLSFLDDDGAVICDQNASAPAHLQSAWANSAQGFERSHEFTSNILTILKSRRRTQLLDLQGIAANLGASRSLNMVLLGAASLALPLPPRVLLRAIRETIDPRHHQISILAFQRGRVALVREEAQSIT